MPRTQDLPPTLRPYVFHGVELTNDPVQVKGDCPFCGKENHFSVKVDSGQYRCLLCEETGNVYTFLQRLHAESLLNTTTDSLQSLADERNLNSGSLLSFGICKSHITGEWLVPAYNIRGALSNLYRVIINTTSEGKKKYTLMSTPGCKIQPFGMDMFLKDPKQTVYIAEGFWDAVCLHGLLHHYRQAGPKLIKTTEPSKALANSISVIGVPGAGNFQQDWFEPLGGKDLYLCYDNDHPSRDEQGKLRERKGKPILPAWDGMQRVVELAGQQTKHRPKSVHLLHWNKIYCSSDGTATTGTQESQAVGHHPDLPNGFDIRDLLRVHSNLFVLQSSFVRAALAKVSLPKNGQRAEEDKPKIKPIECTSFKELVEHYKSKLHFTQSMEYALAVMLATVASTKFPVESQIWFRVIGPPGSGKTTLAEAISAAREYVTPKSILTGFHSGFIDYNEKGEIQKDASLLNRMNGTTVVMKDADTLLSSPSRDRILGELRDIFDGTSRSEYRNKVNNEFEDLRMTFILCGTNALRSMNRSFLGERFLDIDIMKPGEDRTPYIDRAFDNTMHTMTQFMQNMRPAGAEETANEDEQPVTGSMFLKQVTYGFIKQLEENFHNLKVPSCSPYAAERIKAMARLTSLMRARIEREGRADDIAYRHDSETPTRLTQQLTRLPFCLSLVMGKTEYDDEILAIVKQVMLNTSTGFQFEIAEQLARLEPNEGLSVGKLGTILALSDSTVRRVIEDMMELRIVQSMSARNGSGQRGRNVHLAQLTPDVYQLWHTAMGTPVPTPTVLPPKKPRRPQPAKT